jgi:hypothetical protein
VEHAGVANQLAARPLAQHEAAVTVEQPAAGIAAKALK